MTHRISRDHVAVALAAIALLAGTVLVTVLYLGVNGILLLSLPAEELAGSTTAVGVAARRLLGPGAERGLAAVIALAILGSANVNAR